MEISRLIQMAMDALQYSYSPYSGFRVGAALLTGEGRVYTGCNIENAAYSPCNCAERTAFFKAVSQGERNFCKIAIVGGKDGIIRSTCAPCGVCRQVMQEFCGGDFEIILAAAPEKYELHTLKEMLPWGFGARDLAWDGREGDRYADV